MGVKAAYELFPGGLKARIKEERKKRCRVWCAVHRAQAWASGSGAELFLGCFCDSSSEHRFSVSTCCRTLRLGVRAPTNEKA